MRLVHDVNNPLAVVLTNLRYLADKIEDGDLSDAASESLVSAQRTSRMLTDAADLGRLAKNSYAIERRPIDLAELAPVVYEATVPVWHRRELKIELPALEIKTDPALLGRSLINIADHCLARTPAGGHTLLRARDEEDAVCIEFLDQALPFPPGHLASFLCQDLPEITGRGEGFRNDQGIGLYFAGQAARALGAQVAILSPGLAGTGLTFQLRFPRGAE
jgi:signal transduction histidine kinase